MINKKNSPNRLERFVDAFYFLGMILLFSILYCLILNLLFGGIIMELIKDSLDYFLGHFLGHPKVFYDTRVIEYFTVTDKCAYSVKATILKDRSLNPPFYYTNNGYIQTLRVFDAIMQYKIYQASLLEDTFYVRVDGKLYIAPEFVEDLMPPC